VARRDCARGAMFAFSWVGSALASCAATCACHACTFASKEVMRRSARLAYCVLFTLAMAAAWVLRDFAKPLIDKLPCAPAPHLSFVLSSRRASAAHLHCSASML